jgi:hypothetical protein
MINPNYPSNMLSAFATVEQVSGKKSWT